MLARRSAGRSRYSAPSAAQLMEGESTEMVASTTQSCHLGAGVHSLTSASGAAWSALDAEVVGDVRAEFLLRFTALVQSSTAGIGITMRPQPWPFWRSRREFLPSARIWARKPASRVAGRSGRAVLASHSEPCAPSFGQDSERPPLRVRTRERLHATGALCMRTPPLKVPEPAWEPQHRLPRTDPYRGQAIYFFEDTGVERSGGIPPMFSSPRSDARTDLSASHPQSQFDPSRASGGYGTPDVKGGRGSPNGGVHNGWVKATQVVVDCPGPTSRGRGARGTPTPELAPSRGVRGGALRW